jgi:hypothetical protein
MKLPASNAAVCAAALLPVASATIYYAGVAQSGGEFGVWSATSTKGTGLPGRFGVDYQFISTAGVDTMTDQNKVNLHRVAFLLERMCPPSYGLGAKFNETHFDYYKQAINYITKTKGACACLTQFHPLVFRLRGQLTAVLRRYPRPAQLHALQ